MGLETSFYWLSPNEKKRDVENSDYVVHDHKNLKPNQTCLKPLFKTVASILWCRQQPLSNLGLCSKDFFIPNYVTY